MYLTKTPVITCPFRYVSKKKKSPWAAGYHPGVDFKAFLLTPIYAPAKSKIIHSGKGGWGGAYGKHVIGESIGTDGKTYRWIAAHLSTAAAEVGTTIAAGTRIGLSGNTGNTFGPHLHFEVRHSPFRYEDHVNPALILNVKATPAPAPKPTPKPTPKPPVATGPTVTSTSLNAGSYNGPGAKTYKTRVDRYVKRRTTSEVDVINLQEVGNGPNVKGKPSCYMRGRLDKGFGDLYRRHIGADGRYCYSNPGRVKPIKSGVIVAAKSTWYRKDDKQASYLVFEKAGVKAMDVSFHLESEDGAEADSKRVAQMLSIVDKALVIAKANGVDRRNILFVGDTNSGGMVARAMTSAGWRNVAADGKYENRHTYMGWDGKARQRFDYGFVHEGAGPAFMNVIHEDTDISDHAELVIKRTLTK